MAIYKGEMGKSKRIYLDNCVYNRPFDDQSQRRIFLETMAFITLLELVENGEIETINSDALVYENRRTFDPDRKARIESYLLFAKHFVKLSPGTIIRAKELIKLNFMAMDALHIAMSEEGKAEYFITCDDNIIRKGKRWKEALKTKVIGIMEYIALEVD